MDINYKFATLLLLGMSVLSLQFLCSKNCSKNFYSFDVGVRAYPDRDSVYIGDTIWFEINEPTTMKDVSTGNMINYSGAANLSTTIGIAELISVNSVNTQGNSFFKFLPQTGIEIMRPDTNRFREYRLIEANGTYQFKLGITPLKTGVYKLFVGSAANVYRNNDECSKASFGINFKQTNQHLYYNEIVLPGVTLPPGGGIYLFKVK